MGDITLTNAQARRFLLAHHGLWPPHSLSAKSGVSEYIRRVGCIQFDPLNIAGQNPELVLQARVGDFKPAMLSELLYQDRLLLDGWDKQMSIYSVEDWPYFRRRRQANRLYYSKRLQGADDALEHARSALQERGPLSSIDLDLEGSIDWHWAPTRQARAVLESMYFWGELVVHHKVNTRKYYDFAHRCLPPELLSMPDPNPSEDAFHEWFVQRRVGGLGLIWNKAGDGWLGMSGIKSKERTAAIDRLLRQGSLLEVRVADISHPMYMRAQDQPTLDIALGTEPQPRAAILAPLDNLLWDRRFIQTLFDFYYVWEVYKPVAKRRYGYYVLPILYGDRFTARFEPGRDKATGALIVKNWWWEAGVNPTDQIRVDIVDCFRRFLIYLGAEQLHIAPELIKSAGLDWLPAPP